MELTKLLPLVLPQVRNAPRVAATNELRNAAIEFFGKTLAWQETLDPVVIAAGETDGTMTTPDGAVISKIISVKNADGYDVEYASTRTTITIEAPREALTLTVVAALKPSSLATEIPDDLAEEFGVDIAKGAIAQMKAQSGTEWFDQPGAAVAMKLFADAIASEKLKTFTGTRSGSIYAKTVPFF